MQWKLTLWPGFITRRSSATARAICERADVATGTLFLYARDKRELLFLVFRDEVRELLRLPQLLPDELVPIELVAAVALTLPADAVLHPVPLVQ